MSDTIQAGPLDALLAAWTKVDMAEHSRTAIKEIEILSCKEQLALLECELEGLREPFEQQKKDIVAEATPYVTQMRKTFKSVTERAMFVFKSGARSWDLDGLDSLQVQEPSIWERIVKYRYQTKDSVYVRRSA